MGVMRRPTCIQPAFMMGTGLSTLLSASSQMPLCSSGLAGFAAGSGFGSGLGAGAGLGASVPRSTVAAISSSENSASLRWLVPSVRRMRRA